MYCFECYPPSTSQASFYSSTQQAEMPTLCQDLDFKHHWQSDIGATENHLLSRRRQQGIELIMPGLEPLRF